MLLLWGEHDGVIPLGYGRSLADAFPRGRSVLVADAARFPFLENPGAIFAALGEFVATEVNGPVGAGR